MKTRPFWLIGGLLFVVVRFGDADELTVDQQSCIAAIAKIGGKITIDNDRPGKPAVAVELIGRDIKDTDLVHLAGLSDVENLTITSRRITDDGLKHLERLSNLRSLRLKSNAFTGTGLAHLHGLMNLRELDLCCSFHYTDEGFANLRNLINLRKLRFFGVNLSDETLRNLTDMSSLEDLQISYTHVTDLGLEHLKEMKSLRKLNLQNQSKVTRAGIKSLQTALPDCEITR